MAKRINKKVAIIGTAVLLVMFVVVLMFAEEKDLFSSQAKLLEDGDAARTAGEYKEAAKKYHRAKSRAKNDELRLVSLNKLVDLYLEQEEWPSLRGTWGEILQLEPENLAVRYANVKYKYIIADSGYSGYWPDIEKEATDFLDIVQSSGLMNQDTAEWERPEYGQIGFVHESLAGSDGIQRIGQYLYLLRGRARLEMVSRGSVTEPDKVLDDAIADLEKAKELDPTNTAVAWQLAQAFMLRGDLLASRGNFEERDKALDLAISIVKETAEKSPQDYKGDINLLLLNQRTLVSRDINSVLTLEPDYIRLTEKFPDEPQVFALVASYYKNLGPKFVDKAIENINKARQLDPNNVAYIVSAADSYHIKADVDGDESLTSKAISILRDAVNYPGAQDTKGPQIYIHLSNKYSVYYGLATVYFDTLLYSPQKLSNEKRQQMLEDAEDIVHQIEQLRGSGEDPIVLKWQGFLDLAKGNRMQAIQKLYSVYQRLNASDSMDTQLAYALAKEFENTNELGAAADFYTSAFRFRVNDKSRSDSIDRRKPSAVLGLVRVLLRLNLPSNAVSLLNYYENYFNADSQSRVLMVEALNAAGNFEQARKILDEGNIESGEKLRLEADLLQRKIQTAYRQLDMQRLAEDTETPGGDDQADKIDVQKTEELMRSDNERLAGYVKEILKVDPNLTTDSQVLVVCRIYLQNDQKDKALEIARLFLDKFPINLSVRNFVKSVELGDEQYSQHFTELSVKVLEEIENPADRALSLGMFFAGRNDVNEAAVQFTKVLDEFETKASELDERDTLRNQAYIAHDYLFEYAMRKPEMDKAEQLISVAQKYNFDQCQGNFYRARLNAKNEKYEQALEMIEQCLKTKPVSSQFLALRGQVKEALGRTNEAVIDLKQALAFSPLSPNINRALALALYRRYIALGDNTSTDQYIEVKDALQRAAVTNQTDMQLSSLYAEFMGESDSENALALRQRLFRLSPTVQNAVLLGNIALEISREKTEGEEKQALLEIASSAYKDALKIDPANAAAIASYANFCRETDRPDEAEKIISESNNENLQWKYYLSTAQYDKAKPIMERLYAADPQNIELLTGFVSIARITGNKEDMKKYSELLIQADDSIDNNLSQIQGYIIIGLIDEAENKLQSFLEKYPDEPIGQLLQASLLTRTGKLEEALVITNEAVEKDQTNARGWLLRGEINRLLGNYTQAINDLVKSKSLNDNPEVRIALAQSYLASGRASDSILELASIIDDPETPEQARLLYEAIYSRSGNANALWGFYRQMINVFPDNQIWVIKAASLAEKQGNYDVAQKMYLGAWENSVKQGMPNPSILDSYLTSLINSNQFQKALDESSKYVDSEFASVAMVNIGTVKAKMNDREGASQYYLKAVDREQNRPNIVMSILRTMYNNLGDKEVKQYCNQKLAENPDSIVANYVLYYLARNDGEYNQAVRYLEKCIANSEPDSQDYIDAIMKKCEVLSIAYQQYSDNSYLDQAIAAWQQLHQISPDNIEIMNNIAYLLAESGRELPMALEYAEKAVKQSPNNAGILDTYAYVLYKNGRFEDAAEQVRTSVQRYEIDQAYAPAEVYEHLGMIMEALGQKNEAVAAYQRTLEAGQDSLSESKKEQIKQTIALLGG
ncbi:MAG: tetratricopeptide repeat protein [Phycisphaerae bacterium]|jgi:tetratricopeptide (TPR) repeat protein